MQDDNGRKPTVRINKFLSDAGICSRREADRQVLAGKVKIDGVDAVMGDKVEQGQAVTYCGKEISKEEAVILLVVNKPVGVVCTAQKKEKNNVVDFINYPKRIYPVGRLDKDSKGLLLMTNQGELVNKIMKAQNMHEKEYVVTVNKGLTADFIKQMSQGVFLEELKRRTRDCKIWQTKKRTFHIILTQGLNRQIRRMCENFHYEVVELERIRIMNIKLGNLKSGTYRNVTTEELDQLYQDING
ncbi:pseudouridine synthase [Lachnospiraceae bacterium ZAX-1]